VYTHTHTYKVWKSGKEDQELNKSAQVPKVLWAAGLVSGKCLGTLQARIRETPKIFVKYSSEADTPFSQGTTESTQTSLILPIRLHLQVFPHVFNEPSLKGG